jgi:hypothetical protein
MDILHIFIILCFVLIIITITFRLIPPTEKRQEEEKEKFERERINEEERKMSQKFKNVFKRINGSWLGKTRDGFVEIIFENETNMMIIKNEIDVLSLIYHFVSVDEEIILEVNDKDRISQASLRFMKDGRLHFKSNQLEMVLSKTI